VIIFFITVGQTSRKLGHEKHWVNSSTSNSSSNNNNHRQIYTAPCRRPTSTASSTCTQKKNIANNSHFYRRLFHSRHDIWTCEEAQITLYYLWSTYQTVQTMTDDIINEARKMHSVIIRGGSISPLPMSIFLTQNIGDIDILYCSACLPTYAFYVCP